MKRSGFSGTCVHLLTIGVLLLSGAVLAGCEENPVDERDLRPPDITLPDLEGNTFRLSDTQGKVVLLNFFRPSCQACQQEAPELRALHEQLADSGLVIVGIGLIEGEEAVRSFRDQYDLPYTVLVDDGRAALQYGISQTPTTYVIDRDVNLSRPIIGVHSTEEWASLLEPLL